MKIVAPLARGTTVLRGFGRTVGAAGNFCTPAGAVQTVRVIASKALGSSVSLRGRWYDAVSAAPFHCVNATRSTSSPPGPETLNVWRPASPGQAGNGSAFRNFAPLCWRTTLVVTCEARSLRVPVEFGSLEVRYSWRGFWGSVQTAFAP